MQIYSESVGSMPSILLIDNNAADRLALRRAFSNAGVTNPLAMVSDREAVQYLSGEYPYHNRMDHPVPGVILLDLSEPDDFELLTWIRDKFPSGGLLVVALTRLEDVRRISRAYSLGANSFLTKPINASEVQELVEIFSGYWLVNTFGMNEQEDFIETFAYDS
jgi:CheY-like chemotaxis protein